MGCRVAAGIAVVSRITLPARVTPAKAGVSRGSCRVLSPGDPSLRWGDVEWNRDGAGEKTTGATPCRIPAQAGVQSQAERRSRTTTLPPPARGYERGGNGSPPYPGEGRGPVGDGSVIRTGLPDWTPPSPGVPAYCEAAPC